MSDNKDNKKKGFFASLFGRSDAPKKSKDIESIKSMCGCFKIDFNFAETFVFSDDEDYKKSKTYKSSGLEWGQLVVDENNKISIQHLLIVGSKQFPTIVKHWRQDWQYQDKFLSEFVGNNTWKKRGNDKKNKRRFTKKNDSYLKSKSTFIS